MKKSLSILLAVVLCFVFSVTSAPVKANAAVTINRTEGTVFIGNTLTLRVNGTNKYVMWKSNNKKVATVSKKGKVTGISEGNATITATVGAGKSNQKLTCSITVKPRLSVDSTNIICTLDEYVEIPINFQSPRDGECLVCESDEDEDVISAEWSDEENFTLRIIPQDVGVTTITIYPSMNDDDDDYYYDEDENAEELTLNVTVLRDSDWISVNDLDSIGAYVYGDDDSYEFLKYDSSNFDEDYDYEDYDDEDYEDDYDEDSNSYEVIIQNPLVENTVYTDNGIQYKMINGEIYFNVKDLEAHSFMP